jgi:UDP-glucose 6-dehydrogenase
MRIAIFGASRPGLRIATELAGRGRRVVCYDEPDTIARLRLAASGGSTQDRALHDLCGRLQLVDDYRDAAAHCSAAMICFHSHPAAGLRLLQAARGLALHATRDLHVAVSWTVPPDMRRHMQQILRDSPHRIRMLEYPELMRLVLTAGELREALSR